MTPTAAGLYARISLDRNGEAEGVARQIEGCRKLAKTRGLKITEEFIDNDRSAYSGRRRPEWERMLAAVREGSVATVVAWANDRLYRRTRDQLELLEAVAAAGGSIMTAKDGDVEPRSAEGRMRATILGSVAEFESARKAERVSAASAQRAAKGRPHGRPSYGWKPATDERDRPLHSVWQLEPEAATLIREAADRILSGETAGAVTRDWNERSLPTPHGAQTWNHRSLRKLLRRPSTAGLRELNGEIVGDGTWPAILDRPTWEAVVVALRPRTSPQRKPRKYLLSGILVCGVDGERMTGHVTRTRSYQCVACAQRIHADHLDALVTDTVLEALDTPRLAERIQGARSDDHEGDALSDLAEADKRLSDIAAMFGAGEIGMDEYRVARKVAAEARTDAERRLSDRRGTRTLSQALGAPGGIEHLWDDAPMAWRRQLLDAVLERVDIAPINGSGWQPDRAALIWRT